jgi:16S rRNA (adenine1518-N6/adenine1519-N6)-dimethyltransferase
MKKPVFARTARATGAVLSRIAPALAIAGVRPSKSRGQNFLTSGAIAARIVAAAEIGAGDEVLEIGPGLGILTEKIVAHPFRRLTVVELDSRLAAGLHERVGAGRADIRIINADFLSVDFTAVALEPPLKVIGNLPFNVAAAILRRLCDNASAISRMVLMFQREVALRIRARPGDGVYGALSVFTAMYWEIASHFTVAAGSFHPRPKVDAEVLVFKPRAIPAFALHEEQVVLEVVRASFSAPRKTIRNSLGHGLGIAAGEAVAALERAAIDPGARAETLGVADFVRLARALSARRPPEIIEKNA